MAIKTDPLAGAARPVEAEPPATPIDPPAGGDKRPLALRVLLSFIVTFVLARTIVLLILSSDSASSCMTRWATPARSYRPSSSRSKRGGRNTRRSKGGADQPVQCGMARMWCAALAAAVASSTSGCHRRIRLAIPASTSSRRRTRPASSAQYRQNVSAALRYSLCSSVSPHEWQNGGVTIVEAPAVKTEWTTSCWRTLTCGIVTHECGPSMGFCIICPTWKWA